MLFLNNAFTKDITEYDGEVLKEVKTVDGKIYLSNGAIIKEGVVGKFFDIATNDKYGTVFEAGGPDEIGPIVGFASCYGRFPLPIILHSDYRSSLIQTAAEQHALPLFSFPFFTTSVGFAVFINQYLNFMLKYMLRTTVICVKLNANKEGLIWKRFFQSSYRSSESKAVSRRNSLPPSSRYRTGSIKMGKRELSLTAIYCLD